MKPGAEQLVQEAQNAYAALGDWSEGAMLAEMRERPAARTASEAEMAAAGR